MRITVGHVLLIGIVGWAIYTYATPDFLLDRVKTTSDAVKKEVHSLTGLFKSGEAETKNNQSQAPAPVQQFQNEEPFQQQAPPAVEPPPQNPPSFPSAPVVESKPQENKAAVKENPKKKKKFVKKRNKKRSVRKKRKRVAKKKKAPAQESMRRHPSSVRFASSKPAKKGKSGLVGKYVAITLKNGREIKGMLKAVSKTEYTLELPGMGPLRYIRKDVKTIKAVQ